VGSTAAEGSEAAGSEDEDEDECEGAVVATVSSTAAEGSEAAGSIELLEIRREGVLPGNTPTDTGSYTKRTEGTRERQTGRQTDRQT